MDTVTTKRRLVVGTINVYEAEDGWENIHLDKSNRGLYPTGQPPEIVADAMNIPLPALSIDEIKCWQMLEHVRVHEAPLVLAEFHRVLVHGGVLDIQVPDIDPLCRAWVDGTTDKAAILRIIYGDPVEMQDHDLQAHRYGYYEDSLRDLLYGMGFQPGERIQDDLRFRAVRP